MIRNRVWYIAEMVVVFAAIVTLPLGNIHPLPLQFLASLGAGVAVIAGLEGFRWGWRQAAGRDKEESK